MSAQLTARINELETALKTVTEERDALQKQIDGLLTPIVKTARQGRTYSDDQIRMMRALRAQNVSYQKIAERFQCSTTFVRNVEQRNVYRDVE